MCAHAFKPAVVMLLVVALQTPAAAATNSYAGEENREIKALSPEEVEGYLAGKGMGFAKAAELNNYPGPLHVLQLAEELRLSENQRAKSEELFRSMQQEVRQLGARFVAKERELDRLFASKKADEPRLHSLLQEIAVLGAAIRESHLRAHLTQLKILSDRQIDRYAKLRGYDTAGAEEANGERHSH